jgi:hypothetical protein
MEAKLRLLQNKLFQNTVLRSIFGYTRQVTAAWRRVENEELHNSYTPPNATSVHKFPRLIYSLGLGICWGLIEKYVLNTGHFTTRLDY